MTTEVLAPLPIPEQTIVGQGSYTVPANNYGHFQANTSAVGYTSSTTNGGSSGGVMGTGTANSCHQWVKEGDSISIGASFPSGGGTNSGQGFYNVFTNGYSFVYLNGLPVCNSFAGVGSHKNSSGVNENYNITGTYAWSVSLFPIPKENLPDELKEGN